MSTYSLSSPFGRQLFVCEHEKKAVARYVTHEPVWRNQPLIRDHDVVILTEGTSCFYVGLAIAAHRKGVKILSSNGGLIREYNENPHFRSSLADFQSIGGNIDWENRGCVGTLSQEQYIKAVTSGEPRTSVLVCDVSGLLPEDGPYNPTPQTATDRLALLEEALDHDVRHIVFVADHAKHLDSNRGTYGANVFAEQNWHDLMNGQKVKKQGDRKINPEGKIFIVTSPPPDLQKHILTHPADRDVVKRDFRFHQNVALSKGETAEYERSAQGFTKNFKVWKESKLFHEALCEPVQSASLSVK